MALCISESPAMQYIVSGQTIEKRAHTKHLGFSRTNDINRLSTSIRECKGMDFLNNCLYYFIKSKDQVSEWLINFAIQDNLYLYKS